jgi:ferredoxin, 2Fe-2S
MAKLIVVTRRGEKLLVEASPGLSVMQILRDNGVDELLALCGGSCSCATCHVYLEADQFNWVQSPGESESDLLDSSDHRRPTSRLSCQIAFAEHLDGMMITVAPEN